MKKKDKIMIPFFLERIAKISFLSKRERKIVRKSAMPRIYLKP